MEVVPGISAYQAAAAGLGERTHDSRARANHRSRESRWAHWCSRHGEFGVDLLALKASLCLYLSARHVEEVQSTLSEALSSRYTGGGRASRELAR